MLYAIIFISIVILAIVWKIRSKSEYYNKIFNHNHYAEIASWAVSVLNIGEVHRPSIDNNTVMVSSGGILMAFTRTIDENGDTIYFSVSQNGILTTQAVGNRMIYLCNRTF